MTSLYVDLETFSELELRTVGVHRYAEACEIMLLSWALDDEPFAVWDLTSDEPMPARLYEALADPSIEIVCHNVGFDRTILRACWPVWRELFPVERFTCTMVQALSHSLPGGLDRLGQAFRLDMDRRKHEEGRKLVLLFCKPRPKASKIRRATAQTHPEEWRRFKDYAAGDGIAMREVRRRMPRWNYPAQEHALWCLDQRMNDRGFAVDVTLVRETVAAIDREQSRLAERASELTDGAVAKATQRDAMLRHILAEYDVTLPDLTSSTLERRIGDESLPQPLRELLAVRLQASTTSTAKYQVFQRATCSDGRMRGTLQFCGASRTGRDAARLVQPQNFPRPTLPGPDIEAGIEALRGGWPDLVTNNVMELASNAARGCIVAPPGRRLVASDLSNIEGRMTAWLAGEEWKLQAFRDFDIGIGPDIYLLAYARAFGIEVEVVTKPQRQLGKILELSMGFSGGVGAFVTMALNYDMDLNALSAAATPIMPADVIAEARRSWAWAQEKRRTLGLPEHVYVACDGLKRLWRRAHPATARFWGSLENTVRDAVRGVGIEHRCGQLAIDARPGWLRIRLPSGRFMCYPQPHVDGEGAISYLGVSPYTRQWGRVYTFGGKLCENAVQASSRDVLMHAVPAAELAGYEVVLRVHDELLAEAPDDDSFDDAELSAIVSTVPAWASGLPLAASGFAGQRYGKH